MQHPQVTLQSVLLAAELLRVRCRHSGKLLRLPTASLATVGTPTPAVLTAHMHISTFGLLAVHHHCESLLLS